MSPKSTPTTSKSGPKNGPKSGLKSPPSGAPKSTLRNYFRRANLLTSLVLIFPLLIGYQLGVLLLPKEVGNGADMLTGRIFALLNYSKTNYLLFNLGLLLSFVIFLLIMRRRQQFDTRLFIPVIFESGIYALTMGTVIVHLMGMLGINPKLLIAAPVHSLISAAAAANANVPANPFARIAVSLGAGVHEELVFRLVMIPLLTLGCEKLLGMRRFPSLAIAFLVSAILFSAAHHIIGGEAWAMAPFVYRIFCGLIFALLFQFRGFAVAVYTHALYDIYVMLFH